MSTTTELVLLTFGCCGILLALTLFGEFLRQRHPADQPNPVLETYMTRIQSWWAMVLLLSLALLSGPTGVVVLFGFASFAALREFLTLTTKSQADHWSLALAFLSSCRCNMSLSGWDGSACLPSLFRFTGS